jgi:fumarylacetoacetate (FAA) hydrolase
MRLCTFETGGREAPGRIDGYRVVELGAPSLLAWLEEGGEDVAEHAVADVRLRAPIPRPPSVRDFYAFERHVATARAQRGLEMAPEWYQIPVFYFSNPAAILGPDDDVPFPQQSSAWDYELEAAAVIGENGAIAGFTILNDWSARDLQKMEMAVGLGPAKGKDFATSIGPAVVTPDELGD